MQTDLFCDWFLPNLIIWVCFADFPLKIRLYCWFFSPQKLLRWCINIRSLPHWYVTSSLDDRCRCSCQNKETEQRRIQWRWKNVKEWEERRQICWEEPEVKTFLQWGHVSFPTWNVTSAWWRVCDVMWMCVRSIFYLTMFVQKKLTSSSLPLSFWAFLLAVRASRREEVAKGC